METVYQNNSRVPTRLADIVTAVQRSALQPLYVLRVYVKSGFSTFVYEGICAEANEAELILKLSMKVFFIVTHGESEAISVVTKKQTVKVNISRIDTIKWVSAIL